MYTRRNATSIGVALSTGATGLTDAIAIEDYAIAGLVIESTAWTAANISFQVGDKKGATFYDLYNDSGVEVVATVGGASRAVSLDEASGSLAMWRYLKLRSGVTATPVAQADPRTLRLHLKG